VPFFPKKEESETEGEDVPPPEPVPLWWSILKYFGFFACLGIAFLLMIYFRQESMLYCPSAPFQYIEQNPHEMYKSPTARKLKYEELWIETEDQQKLQGWLMTQGETYRGKDTVVFMHENAGNIGLRLDYFALVCQKAGVNVVAFAYRGYSASTGAPDEQGLNADARAIAKYVKGNQHFDKNRVFLVGRSLGGAVATHLIAD